MKKIRLLIYLSVLSINLSGQQTIIPAENLVSEGIPALSTSIVNEVRNYTESRGASLVNWHPLKKEML